MSGQRVRLAAFLSFFALLIIMAPSKAQSQASRQNMPTRTDTPSGFPVPRFVSLKAKETYCRQGPSFSHPVLITYMRQGLPVMVIAETRDHWRKTRDLEGDECWVHATKISGEPTVLVIRANLALQKKPNAASQQAALLEKGVIARVDASKDDWVRISVGRIQGWAESEALWGATDSDLFSR